LGLRIIKDTLKKKKFEEEGSHVLTSAVRSRKMERRLMLSRNSIKKKASKKKSLCSPRQYSRQGKAGFD